MKKKLVTFLIILSALNLVGCNKEQINNTEEISYVPPVFVVDSNTIKKEDMSSFEEQKELEQESSNEDNNNHEDKETEVGEVILDNNDNSVEYTIINDKDIVYKDTTFVDLYTALSDINSKYGINNLINFIVKTYNVDVDTIYSRYEKDEVSSYEDEQRTIDEQLSEYDSYEQIKQQYNGAVATWKITLMDSNRGHRAVICGCYDYIVIIGIDANFNVDMSQFDLSEFNDEVQLESTEESTEESSQSEDVSEEESNEEQKFTSEEQISSDESTSDVEY